MLIFEWVHPVWEEDFFLKFNFTIKVLSVMYFNLCVVEMVTCFITMDTVSNYFSLILCFFISYKVCGTSDLKLFDSLVYFISVTV